MTNLNPATLHKPGGLYSHAVETPADARWLHCAGQIGVAPDGTIAESFEAQAEQAWTNLRAVLAAAGMGVDDIVKVTHFLIRPTDVAAYRPVVARHLGDARPASTMLVIQALARPEFLIEVEAVAAQPTAR
jgi:enamine deaminase RidA (YjgF/YER057c/UK114 family)